MNHRRAYSSFQTPRSILFAALTTLSALGVAACKSTDEAPVAAAKPAGRADLSNELTAKALVVSVDPDTRMVTLLREDGSMFSVQCGPAVRNFDQIKSGDTLRVQYKESLAATVHPPEKGTAPVEGAFVAGRAKPGEKPAAGAGIAASARVKIESVDLAKNIVVFALDSGELRTVRAARPEGREFIKGLKVGDIVQLDYSVSVALSVEKL